MGPDSVPTRKNELLAALPDSVWQRLQPHLQAFELEAGRVLHEPGDRVRDAYFPEQGIISVVNVMLEGRAIEVGTIGREGMSGVPALLGIDLVPYRYVVQVPGSALRLKTTSLIDEAGADTPLRRLLLRYYVAFTSQVMQSVACAGLHSVEQRCCRWLLTTHDRVSSDRFSLTHEFLAFMLGVRRSSVSQVMKRIQDRGLIRYRHGSITIVDRQGLEGLSCECYQAVADAYRKMVGWNGGHDAVAQTSQLSAAPAPRPVALQSPIP